MKREVLDSFVISLTYQSLLVAGLGLSISSEVNKVGRATTTTVSRSHCCMYCLARYLL